MQANRYNSITGSHQGIAPSGRQALLTNVTSRVDRFALPKKKYSAGAIRHELLLKCIVPSCIWQVRDAPRCGQTTGRDHLSSATTRPTQMGYKLDLAEQCGM
uniref:Uncharacterized protein n=1 Tax=Trichuris muris TaxID=70415 RepID=A0A5S6QEE4_TRIMR